MNSSSFNYLIDSAYDCAYCGYGFKSFCELNKDALNEIGEDKMQEYWNKGFNKCAID